MYNNDTQAILDAARAYRAAYIRETFRTLFRRAAPAVARPAHAG